MEVKKIITTDTQSFNVGDTLSFRLNDGELVEAMAVKAEQNDMVFLLVDCLHDEEPMNRTATNCGGYDACDLRKKLNGAILDRFPKEVRGIMVPFENGDFLRLPTEKEILGVNVYGEKEPVSVEQFEHMKLRRNRIAFQGHNGEWEWYWLQNKVKGTATYFAYVNTDGLANSSSASASVGVRPAFKITNL